MEEGHTMGVVAWTVQQEVFRSVRLCGAPGAVGCVSHAKPVQVCIEAGVANPEPCHSRVQGPNGGVSPPVVSCVLSNMSQ